MQLFCAPRKAFHATALYMLQYPLEDDDELRAAIAHLSPRELVSKVLEPAPGLMAALKRCGAVVEPLNFYLNLNDLLRSSIEKEISSERAISNELVTFLRLTQHLDPLVRAARQALRLDLDKAQKFHEMICFCRSLNILRDDEAEARALRFSAEHGLGRYINKRLERCVSPWTIALPPPMRFVKTAKELIALGAHYGNCLGRDCYKAQLGLGSHIYVALESPFNCIAELKHEFEQTWSVVECEHSNTRKALPETRRRIAGLLTEAGMNVRPHAFSDLWSEIGYLRSRRQSVPFENQPHIYDLWDATWANQSQG